MCIWKMENNWSQVKEKLQRDDVLSVSTLKELSDAHGSIREKLLYCKNCGVQLSVNGICLQEEIYMDFLGVMEKEEQLRKQRIKYAQKQGIEDALLKRRQGLGSYGRPKADLPDGFEEQIRYLREHHMSLESYRKETKLKKSTFYKYAKLV